MARTRTLVRPVGIGEGIAEARAAKNEANDCVVRAITAASNGAYSYDEVHALCKQHGRKDGDGMYPSQSFPLMLKMGFELKWICGTTNGAMCADRIAKELQLKYRRVKGVTLDRARIGLQNGSYVVGLSGHFTCIRKGDVIDSFIQRGGRSVCSVWLFKGKPE